MGIADSFKSRLTPKADGDVVAEVSVEADAQSTTGTDPEKLAHGTNVTDQAGVTQIEAVQAIWGKTGRYLVIAG